MDRKTQRDSWTMYRPPSKDGTWPRPADVDLSAAFRTKMIRFFRQNLLDGYDAAWWWQMAVPVATKKDWNLKKGIHRGVWSSRRCKRGRLFRHPREEDELRRSHRPDPGCISQFRGFGPLQSRRRPSPVHRHLPVLRYATSTRSGRCCRVHHGSTAPDLDPWNAAWGRKKTTSMAQEQFNEYLQRYIAQQGLCPCPKHQASPIWNEPPPRRTLSDSAALCYLLQLRTEGPPLRFMHEQTAIGRGPILGESRDSSRKEILEPPPLRLLARASRLPLADP